MLPSPGGRTTPGATGAPRCPAGQDLLPSSALGATRVAQQGTQDTANAGVWGCEQRPHSTRHVGSVTPLKVPSCRSRPPRCIAPVTGGILGAFGPRGARGQQGHPQPHIIFQGHTEAPVPASSSRRGLLRALVLLGRGCMGAPCSPLCSGPRKGRSPCRRWGLCPSLATPRAWPCALTRGWS